MTTTAEHRIVVARAKRFLLAFNESRVIDDLALKVAGAPNKREQIEKAADELAESMQGASPNYVRFCRATFVVVLCEKIRVAEAGGGGQWQCH